MFFSLPLLTVQLYSAWQVFRMSWWMWMVCIGKLESTVHACAGMLVQAPRSALVASSLIACMQIADQVHDSTACGTEKPGTLPRRSVQHCYACAVRWSNYLSPRPQAKISSQR